MRTVVFLFLALLAAQGLAADWRAIPEEIRRTPKRLIPNAGLAKASDLTGHLPDGIHFDTPSYEILGVRYYDAWKRLTGEALRQRGAL